MPTSGRTASSDKLYSAWDIAIVPFPYTDRTSDKRRPALIVSTPVLQRDHGLVWVMMITSAENRGWTGDVHIANLDKAGLPAPSLIRTAKVATVDAAHILGIAGSLGATERREVVHASRRFSALMR